MHPCRERPEVGRDLGRELDAHLARGEQPGGQGLGDRFVRIRPIGDEGLGDGDGGDAVAGGDDLGVAGERRDRREPGLLGEIGHELEFRVETRLDAAIRLEEHGLRRARPRCWTGPRRGRAPRPSRRLVASPVPDGRRAPPSPGRRGRRRRRSSGAPRSSDRRPWRPPAPATHRRPGRPVAAGRRSGPTRYGSALPSAARIPAIARTWGPPASRTKASSSVTSSIVRPLSPYQRAAARSARSRPRRATSTASRLGPSRRFVVTALP